MPIGSVMTLALVANFLGGPGIDGGGTANLAPRLQLIQFSMTPQEEAESVQFCMEAGLGDEDFCGCWTGSFELDRTWEDYQIYRNAIVSGSELTGQLKDYVDSMLDECRMLTSGAR